VVEIVLWSDIACPWATLVVHRIHQARARLQLEERVTIDHRAFPLELFNQRPTPKRILDAEVGAVGQLAPDFGWEIWQADPSQWPGTVLLALEAVQAAKDQSLFAAEQLDYRLRRALFAESRPVGMRHVILEVADRCDKLDTTKLAEALDDGRARRTVMDQKEQAERDDVKGSPHAFLADGTNVHNPGVRMHWEGEKPGGFPVIDADDPEVVDDLVRRAAG
jgi:predicted DsbA family dithiol-disulfide isomerase